MLLHTLFGALLALAAPATASPLHQVKLVEHSEGTLSLVEGETTFTFRYNVDPAQERNWIGVYHQGGGPKDGKSRGQSLVWDWAPDAEGTVTIDASELTPGPYEAWLLADNGYVAIDGPLALEQTRQPGQLEFFVNKVTLKNARVGDAYEANIGGLLGGGGGAPVSYAVNITCAEDIEDCAANDWLSISESGVLSGTPSAAGTSQFNLSASTAGDGTTSLTVSIPVVAEGETLVRSLNVLSYNLWYGGTKVKNYHAKQVAFIALGGFDIVALQETTSDHALRLAHALGWDVFQSSRSVGIISRYPIAETYKEHGHGGAVRVALDGDRKQINVWGVHLNAYPYGPYGFCFDGKTADQVRAIEDGEARRGPQTRETLSLMADHLANTDNIPVILAGDFNAPSELDWTDATADAHCGAGAFDWPTSKAVLDAGLTDSYRVAHPDPVKEPGITWSPIYLDNSGRPEPLDRIDFVYYKGDALKVVSSEVHIVGKPKPEPNHQNNLWTSDHAAVSVKYKLS